MTEIILVRHGQTALNAAEVFRGRLDVDLDETGARQAEQVAGFLAGRRLEAVYSSPLLRAVRTARAIGSRQERLGVLTVPELTDMDLGEWQGLSSGEARERYPEVYGHWLESPHLARIPGAESLDEVRQRSWRFIEGLIPRHEGAAALVSHRVVSKVLICAMLGLDNSHFWNIRQDTCGVTTFRREEGRFVLVEHNNTSFMGPEERTGLSDF
jgi:broad specificity phosphatase PhoE